MSPSPSPASAPRPPTASDALPPHDDAAEAGALACLLLDEPSAPALLDQLQLDHFYDLRHRELYRALHVITGKSLPINPITLHQHLRDHKLLDDIGGLTYLAALPEHAPSAAQFPVYLETLRDRAARRAFLQSARETIQTALDTSRPIDLPSLDAELERRRFDPDKPPPPLRAIYKLGRIPICTPGNLSTITASSKAGKSGFIGALLAAPMATTEADCLGLFSRNDEGRALLHIDTEQSHDDHWNLVNTALKRAGLDREPPWLHSYYLTGMSPDEAWSAVRTLIRKADAQCGGFHAIILDGVADLVQDVNDATRSNALVSRLHKLAIDHDCPVICVIHFNPGTDKSRGHLGSQLERKAESNLRLDKTNDITEIYSEKQRRAPIHKGEGICFRYDEALQRHVTVLHPKEAAAYDLSNEHKALVQEIFAGKASMKSAEIVQALMEHQGCARATAERRMNSWLSQRFIKKVGFGLYTRHEQSNQLAQDNSLTPSTPSNDPF